MKMTLKFVMGFVVVCVLAISSSAMAEQALVPPSFPGGQPAAKPVPSQSYAPPKNYTSQEQHTVHEQSAVEEDMSSGSSSKPPYSIIAGDVLQITVWKEDGLDQETLVLPGGTISFPLVGTIMAQGKTPNELQAIIKDKLKKYIPDAAVTVSVKAALGHTVSVIGQVTKPGEFVMGRRLTVMQALSQAGGLTPYASEHGIKILRHDENGKETSIPFPYSDVASGDDLEKDIVLSPGDVIVVPTAGLL